MRLTRRELQISFLVHEALTNKEIAQRLKVTEGTVKQYISAIYEKFGFHGQGDRISLALYVERNFRHLKYELDLFKKPSDA